jgi:hypothetical protein
VQPHIGDDEVVELVMVGIVIDHEILILDGDDRYPIAFGIGSGVSSTR